MGLLNVRLDRDMERKVKALREEGLVISELIRAAVNQAYSKHQAKRRESRLEILQRLRSSYPAECDDLPARYNLANRQEMRAAMLERHKAKARRVR